MVTKATAPTRSHSTGRQRRDGSPEGNRSKGRMAAQARSGYQNHVCVQAASRAAAGSGPGLLKATAEYASPMLPMPVRNPTVRKSQPIGLPGRRDATTAPTIA
jgi:hypothetical protein